jgi:hypothetical protein
MSQGIRGFGGTEVWIWIVGASVVLALFVTFAWKTK